MQLKGPLFFFFRRPKRKRKNGKIISFRLYCGGNQKALSIWVEKPGEEKFCIRLGAPNNRLNHKTSPVCLPINCTVMGEKEKAPDKKKTPGEPILFNMEGWVIDATPVAVNRLCSNKQTFVV